MQDVDLPYNKYSPVDCPASAWQSFPGLRHYPDCGEESGVPGIGEQNVTYPDTKVERVQMSVGW